MKKFISLTLIYLVAFALFSQSDTTGLNMEGDTLSRNSRDGAETMFELGVGNVVVMGRGDTLNLDGPTVLSNGQPLGADPIINTSVYNVLRSYDAEQREATGSDDYMFIDAFSKSKIIWIPNDVLWPDTADAQYLISGTVGIPHGTELMFDIGAMINVAGLLKGQYTFIDADIHQIFTITSNLSTDDYDWASSNVSRPEWFGANPIGNNNAKDAIQKCVDVFKRNILLDGAIYFIEGTIELNSANTLTISPMTVIVPSAKTPDATLFKITEEPFVIEGGVIQVPRGYHGWIFEIAIDRLGINDRLPRYASSLKNVVVTGPVYYPLTDYTGKAYKGIRIKSGKVNDYTYFSVVNNIDFYRVDTAIYLTGHPTSGMSNSWHWNNITIDNTMTGIVLDHRAAGHVFNNLIIQPNTKQLAVSDGVTPLITVYSKYNVFSGMIWDLPNDIKVIKLGPDAAHNWFNNFGHNRLYTQHVLDLAPTKALNTFSTANPFEPTRSSYNYYTMQKLGIGTEPNKLLGEPQLSIASKHFPVTNTKRKTTLTGGALNGTKGIASGIAVMTQTSGNMADGFGGGFVFIVKEDAMGNDTLSYTTNMIGRLYSRRDGADNQGLMQFFTKGVNASSPTMTLRNSGKIGIGTTDPKSTLQVNGGIQYADDTDAASAKKAGTVRYRTDSNNSYVEMCVQTGASTYEWVIMHQKSW